MVVARLGSGAWLEKELGAPDLRVLDCTVASEALPDGGLAYRSGRPAWERRHILRSAHLDLDQLSDPTSSLPYMLPDAERFAAVMGGLGVGDGTRVVVYDSAMNVWAARVWWTLRAFG